VNIGLKDNSPSAKPLRLAVPGSSRSPGKFMSWEMKNGGTTLAGTFPWLSKGYFCVQDMKATRKHKQRRWVSLFWWVRTQDISSDSLPLRYPAPPVPSRLPHHTSLTEQSTLRTFLFWSQARTCHPCPPISLSQFLLPCNKPPPYPVPF
jgi:hypothetical protein